MNSCFTYLPGYFGVIEKQRKEEMLNMSKRKRDRQFWESATMNNLTFRHYYNRLTELAISMFEWKNLPASIDPRFLEMTLFNI